MTVRHLKIFVAVFRTQNVTRAAQEMHMTQPTVTRAIQELEEHYGVKLFERISHRLRLTDSARQLYAHAVHIIDSFERMDREMSTYEERSLLRVGATPTLGSTVLPRAQRAFAASYPGVKVKTAVYNGMRLQKELLDNDLDLALIEDGAVAAHLKNEEFSRDRLVPILPPSDRRAAGLVSIQELGNDPILLREEGSVGRALVSRVLTAHGIAVEPAMESISTGAIVKAVHEGLGISFLPELLVRREIASGFVSTCRIAEESFERSNYIVFHENKFLTAAARAFIAACAAASEERDP